MLRILPVILGLLLSRPSFAITNSRPAQSAPAVVRILAGQVPVPVCSGALIHPSVVLTAAHCLTYAPTVVELVDDSLSAKGSIRVVRVVSHPGYDRRTNRFDLAVLLLETPALTIAPLAIERSSTLKLAVGTSLRLLGFGSDGESESGIEKRQGMSEILELDNESIRIGGESRPCTGDSGGPALVLSEKPGSFEQQEFLAAVISRGDAECSERSLLTRVDSQFDVFVDPLLRDAKAFDLPAGSPCLIDSNCAGRQCAMATASRSVAHCSAICVNDGECGRGFVCDTTARLCREATPARGFLQTCMNDGQCDSLLCAAAQLGEARVCTRPCSPTDASSCDAASSCVAALDSAAPHVCIPRTVPTPAELGRGCSLAAAGAAGDPSPGATGWLWLWPLLALAGLPLSRRLAIRLSRRRERSTRR